MTVKINGSTGVDTVQPGSSATNANWRLVVRAWA